MSQRDLTYNSRRERDEETENPFINPIDEQSSESFVSNHQSSSQLDEDQFQYGRPFNNYNGYAGYYSQNGTTSNLLSKSGSETESHSPNPQVGGGIGAGVGAGAGAGVGVGAGGPHNLNLINSQLMNDGGRESDNINVPSEYDRYPSMNGSRVVSSTSLSSQFLNQNSRHSQHTNTSSFSNKSSNPFVSSADFSPFGGYPASSFPLHIDEKEPDDYLHNPDPIADAKYDKNRFLYDMKSLDRRSLGGLMGIITIFLAAIAVFVVVPALTFSGVTEHDVPESYEVLSNYKYPLLAGIRTTLIDPDTPEEALSRKVRHNDETWKLAFSDEFNAVGRTFYEGDDQFFYAPDFHYAATQDLEWYDPDAVTTDNGTAIFRMDAFKNHDLFYRSGMLHSWNKMCFTQGLIEISAQLANYGNISGLWPGLWTMGNLGRPGYMGTTHGVWPYTYDSCDAGITFNQSSPDGISYLPGQKLNKCTCKGEDHPSPGKGRGAPEIDLLEGEVSSDLKVGVASQSMQIAPFDIWYMPNYDFVEVYNFSVTTMNTYTGGPFQQAVSGVTTLNTTWYERGSGEHHFQKYAYEYMYDDDDGYCTWYVGDNPTFTVYAYSLSPNGNIGWRKISKEPMTIIMNLGISNNWAYIDWQSMVFPAEMKVDYVRIYQPDDDVSSITCDPSEYPTVNYIDSHSDVYQNVNKTEWDSDFPKNSLLHGC